MKRMLQVALTIATALSAGSAVAHDDPNGDGNRYSEYRCDTYYRDTHESGATRATRHSEDDTSEFDAGDPTGTGAAYVHNEPGHYVVRGNGYYVEVVGGGGYNRDGNQGGWVQGEVDPVSGLPDADFHVGSYAGTSGGNHSENACVSALNAKVGESGVQDGPGTYCVADMNVPKCEFIAGENGLRAYTEYATGMKLFVRGKRAGIMKTIVDYNTAGPLYNHSYGSSSLLPGDSVTCELTLGTSSQLIGRVHCGA